MASAPLVAQHWPDVSGRWLLESSPQATAPFARELTVRFRQPPGRVNERGEPVEPDSTFITVEREGQPAETRQIGRVWVRDAGNGVRRLETVTWRGPVLEFRRSTYSGKAPETGVWEERLEAWSLEPDGRMRVTIAARSSSAPAATAVAFYRRPGRLRAERRGGA